MQRHPPLPGPDRRRLAWLVPRILASPAFTPRNSLLVTTCDGGSRTSNRVATVFAGPEARTGCTSDTRCTHWSLLRTIEETRGAWNP